MATSVAAVSSAVNFAAYVYEEGLPRSSAAVAPMTCPWRSLWDLDFN